jgi:hypothetical protein
LNKAFIPKPPHGCLYFAIFSDFSVCITQRTLGAMVGRGAAGERWYSLGDITEAAFDWFGLKDSFCYWLTAELGSQATSQPLWLSHIVFSRLY